MNERTMMTEGNLTRKIVATSTSEWILKRELVATSASEWTGKTAVYGHLSFTDEDEPRPQRAL